jgi:hypothetical protein
MSVCELERRVRKMVFGFSFLSLFFSSLKFPLPLCVWYNHLFIDKIIYLFPPNCLVPKQLKKSLWSLIFPPLLLVSLSKYFFCFFVFWYPWKKRQYQCRLINDFEISMEKTERVESNFFLKDSENAKNNANTSRL